MRRTVLFGLVALAVAGSAWARDFTLGGLTIGHPWSRPAPQGGTGAGFLTVTNHGTKADTLVAISTPVAARAEIHESMVMGGKAMMHPRPGGLTVKPGATGELKPGGWHIMFVGLKRPLRAGDRFPATLTFKTAGKVEVEFIVQTAAPAPAAATHH